MKKSITGCPPAVRAALLASVAFALPGIAHAQTWSGLGGDAFWSTPTNWVGDVSPVSGNATIVSIPSAGFVFPSQVDAPFTLNRLSLIGASAITLGGQSISFDGAAPLFTLSGPHFISNDFFFLATTTVDAQTNQTLTGQTAGSAGLTKIGAGRLTLSGGPLTWGGTTTVSAGTLQIGNGTSGPNSFASPILLTGDIEFRGSGAPVSVFGSVSGTGGVTISGGPVLGMGPTWTHSGPTNITGGQLSAPVNSTGRLTVTGTGVLQTGDSFFGSLSDGATPGTGSVFSNATAITIGSDNTSTTFSGTLAGSGGITKVGMGRLTLATNVLTWGGTTTVSAGTLQIGNGTSGPNSFASPILLTGDIEFRGSGAPVSVFGSVSGTGGVTISGGPVLGIGPAWTHSGPTNITGGQLSAPVNSTGRLTVTGTGVLQTGDSFFGSLSDGATPGTGSVFSNATAITIGSDNTSTTFSGTLAGSGGITKVGTGRLTLATSVLTWGGTTTVSAGTLQIGNGTSGPNSFASPILLTGDIEFRGSGAPVSVFGSVSGTGGVTISGGQVLGIGPAWTHSGPTNITGGQLSAPVNSTGRLTVTGTGVLQTGDSFFGSLSDGATPGTGSVNSNATAITIGSDNTSTTFSGLIGGAGGLTKTGSGTFTIGGAVLAMGGALTVNGGRVDLLATGVGAGIVNAGGTLGGTGRLSGSVTVNPGGTLSPGLSPGVINTGNLNVAGTLAAEILGATAGTQYDVVNVTGTVTLSGTLSLSGAYVPALGEVFTIIQNDGADPVTGTFAGLAEGATVAFNGATLRISYAGGSGNDVTLTAVSTTNVVWNGAGANDNWSTGTNWVAGVSPASGATTFVTFPAASARFAPAVDANWTINRMDVTSATAYTLGGSTITFAGAGPQLNVTAGAHTIGNPLALPSSLAVNNATNLTLTGAIGGAGGLAKSGAGRLAINGAGGWAGGTTISGGTLLANGTVPGPLVVNAGGTLGGTGTVAGTVTVNAGGSFAPGLSPGITSTGDLSIAGTLVIEIEGATIGTQYDSVTVTGTVGIAGGALLVTGAFVPVAGTVFTIVSNDGADAVTGTFLGLAEGATVTLNGVPLRISYVGGTGNDITLTAQAVVAVPVPTLGEWAMLLLVAGIGLAGALRLRRRDGGLAA